MTLWQFTKAHRPQFYHKKKTWPRFLGFLALYSATLPVKGAVKLSRAAYRAIPSGPLHRDMGTDTKELERRLAAIEPITIDVNDIDLTDIPTSAQPALRAFLKALIKDVLDPPTPPPKGDLLLEARWRDHARRYIYAHENERGLKAMADLWSYIGEQFITVPEGPSFGTVSVQPSPQMVEDIIMQIAAQEPLFADLRATLNRNATDKEFTLPTKDKNFSAAKYFKDTPLLPLLDMQVPYSIPLPAWKEHAFMCSPSGFGKTMSIKAIIKAYRDIPDPPAIFSIDCMGGLHRTLSEKYAPITLDRSIQMGFFNLGSASLYRYIFKAIDQKLTERQFTMLYLLVRLLAKTDATLMTLHDICAGLIPITAFSLDGLEEIEQKFFKHQFSGKDRFVNETKAQIASRLMTFSTSGLFHVFNGKGNLDLRSMMDSGKLVSVDATGEGGIVFGRFIIASLLHAAKSRQDIPENKRKLALLIIDESKDYMDETTIEISVQARQLGLGMFQATQFMADIDPKIKAAILGNTAIRFAGPVEGSDAFVLSQAMRCNQDFIKDMKKKDHSHSEWACYVRNEMPRAIKLSVPMGVMEGMPTRKTTASAAPESTAAPTPQSPPNPSTKFPSIPSPKPTTKKSTRDPDTDYHTE